MKLLYILVLVLVLVLVSINSFAKESAFRISKEKIFWLSEEESTWILKTVLIKSNKMPDVIDTKYFRSEKQAVNHLHQYRNLKPLAPQELKNALAVTTEAPGTSLWKVENQWSWEWEKKYGEWVAAHGNVDFLATHNIATDCADAIFAYRWIFSRIYKLPAAFHFFMSQKLFSQDSIKSEWLSIPTDDDWAKDERFFKSLDYLLTITNIDSLIDDSYPVDISREALIPGVHWAAVSHSYLSLGIVNNRYIQLIYSMVPRNVKLLYVSKFGRSSMPKEEDGDALAKFRWPIKKDFNWILKPKMEMPFYSRAQYSKDLMNNELKSYVIGFYRKLGLDTTTFDLFRWGVQSAQRQVSDRTIYVIDAKVVCDVEDCSPNTLNFENYSTFIRDQRLQDTFDQVIKIKSMYESTDPKYNEIWADAMNSYYSIQDPPVWTDEGIISIKEIMNTWKTKKYSSDPRDSINKRWGRE